MSYVSWSFVAMITYGVATFLLKLVFRSASPAAGLAIANTFVVFAGLGWMLFQGRDSLRGLGWTSTTALLLVASVVLAASIGTLYRALSLGPATVVMPIFAMSFVVVAVLGFIVLGEPVKATRVAGIALAAVAVVLLTR